MQVGQANANTSAVKPFAQALAQAGFKGDIRQDVSTRLLAATDNSVYQVMPTLVLMPASPADIALLSNVAAQPQHAAIRFAPRGGGTGTNGQSLTDQVVVDTSRHTNRILSIDVEANRVEVEPGVVLGQLNAALSPHGQFFPPTTSTASRVTIGGMISTDACGKGSRIYGRTGDYVESLQLHLPDGREITCRRYTAEELAATSEDPGLCMAQAIRDLLQPQARRIREDFPDLHRSLTGYNLHDALMDDGSIDLTRLIAGAEGTLGLISRVTLRTRPLPACKAVIVVRYRDFDEALRDARWLLDSKPAAVETLDDHIRDLAQQDPLWERVSEAMTGTGGGAADRVMCNLVELIADSRDALERQIAELAARLEGRGSGYHVARDPSEMAALWNIRSRSVGMLGRTNGSRKPVAFVEDTAVPPEALADYIAEFRELLARHGVDYAMYGHVDVGCLHVRPALDMTDPEDRRRLRAISDEVVALVRRYRGLLWGEHGKGYRGEYTKHFFGDALYALLARVKALFDPDNRLNPGKIVAPSSRPEPLHAIDDVPFRGEYDARIPPETRMRWGGAMACNGNGVCFDWDTANVLCPSYKVTGDRIHSPKGRATLLREWLRELADEGQDPDATPQLRLPRKRSQAPDDIAHAVHDAMAGCLGCKACATQCPVHVDIPTMRSRFLDIYHRTYRRPVRDHLVARAEDMAPWMARFAMLARPALASAPGRHLARRLGLADLPVPARRTGLAICRERGHLVTRRWADARKQLANATNGVAVMPDAFTGYYERDTLPAACDLIAASGATPVVLPFMPSGKALHAQGFMAQHRRASRALLKALLPIARDGTPLVVVEPSIGLFLREDCRGLASASVPVQLLPEWIHAQARNGSLRGQDAPAEALPYTLFIHCTEQTHQGEVAARAWADAFAALGASMDVRRVGCCGMAGAYGHQAEQLENSRTLFDATWRPALEESPAERILATGYSCRTQVARFTNHRARHPAVALAALALQGDDS